MKSNLFFVSLMMAHSTMAQTVPSEHVAPRIGDRFTSVSMDENSVSVSECEKSGENQTWDFSSAILSTSSLTETYVDVATTSGSDEVKEGANIAKINSEDDAVSYYNVTDTKFENTGIDGVNNDVVFTDPWLEVAYPIVFGDAYTNLVDRNTIYPTADVKTTGTSEFTVDGTGTLILPHGTYENVIRVKREIRLEHVTTPNGGSPDPVINQDFSYYTWHRAGTRERIMGMSVNPDGPLAGCLIAASIANDVTGINDIYSERMDFELTPNPALNHVTLRLNSVVIIDQLKIYDLLGSEKMDLNLAIDRGAASVDVDLHSLSKGVYLVKITSGDELITKRLVKQ